ncbi:tetratricopeptide repeat protein [Streptomyces varsoviensis]|uniref:tetratricopeptide repeat protein n=1 Tax=Streptomyces varsoviensis TaxID=67373 RepID=UPI0033F660BB
MTDQAVGEQGAAARRPSSAGRTAAATAAAPGAFYGRRRELQALRSDIGRAGLDTISGRKAPRSRVLLIAGRPGSGRSALAEELARRLAKDYPDGVLRARLTEPGGEPVPVGRAARELLGALGAGSVPGAGEDELSQALRTALHQRRVLLLLDDAASAEQVDALLPDAPDSLLVAVARGPLTGVPDVRPCTLGGLDKGAAVELIGRYAGSTRITCDPVSADSVVEECGGQPAALVLIGGWLAARPKASVADAVNLLRQLPADEGQESGGRPLARAFRLAYESLPAPAARVLRLLALAPAGLADAHTASALAGCSLSAAQSALEDFAAQGLLHAVGPAAAEPPAGPAADVPPQYEVPGALHPMLRALLAAQERPAEAELARARMLERTVRQLHSCRAVTEPADSPARKRLAEVPRALRFGSADEAARWLRLRRPALLAAARLAVRDGQLDTLARRLVSALARALTAHQGAEAAAPDLYDLHQLVLDVAGRRRMPVEKAAALLNLGDLDARAERTEGALVRYREALVAAREAADPYATGRALESIAASYQELGDWQRAADWYGRALELRLTRGELADEARLYGRLGAVHTYAGRWAEALRDWRAAAAACRRLRDLPGHARALGETARVQEYAGRPREALRICREALDYAREAGDVRLRAALELRLADTLERLGDPAAAGVHRASAEALLGAPSVPAAEAEGGEPLSTYEISSSSRED